MKITILPAPILLNCFVVNALTNRDLKAQTGQYARIANTRREDYLSDAGTEGVGNARDRKLK